jgi:hypothetical protein
MTSAAVVAQMAQEKAAEEDSSLGNDSLPRITTAGATATEDGKIQLHGNPFRTTPEVFCKVCRLPRLLYPTTGKNSQPPEPGKQYCSKHPYIDKEGFDIYGKSLNAPILKKKVGKDKDKDKDSKSTKNDPSPDPSESPNEDSGSKAEAMVMPTGKCPNCIRYFAYHRIARHLNSCMGIGGRKSSQNAKAKLTESTPRDSRAGTPKPLGVGGPKKRKVDRGSEDDEEEKTPVIKKIKKGEKKKGAVMGKGKAVKEVE